MPDLDDLLNHASDELATMPVPARPFIPQPRRVGPALVVVALLAGAGGLTAIVRSQSAPDHMLVANTPTTTATSTVQTSDGTASTSVTEPPGTATPQTSVTPATTTPVLTTSDPLAFTQPQQVISGATGGLAWTLDVSTESGSIRCLRFTAEATSRTFCLTPLPDELAGMSFVVRTPHPMAAIGQALPSEIKGPITASRSTITPATRLTTDGTMFMAAVTLATDPIVRLPSGEECDYAGILDAIEAADAAEGYQPTHLLNVAIDHCRGDIAAGSSRAAEPFAAQTAFRIFNRSGTTWLASAADHMNNCLDTESGTPPCLKLGYSKPAPTGPPATADLWEALPNTGLSKRVLPLVAAMGDQVLVVGGASGWDQVATGNLRDGRVLNATGTAWQSIPDAPVALTSGLPSAWTGTDLFLIAATGELLSFTPSSKMWATLPRMRGNPDIGTAMAWIGSELYAMDYLGQTFAYSPTQKTWRVLESPTTLHADHPALKSVVRGSNWILGGGSTLAIFDTKASAWLPVPTIPSDSMVLVIGQDVLLTTVDFHNPAPTSRLNGANQFVPTGDTVDFLWGGNSATFLWVVDGHWVGDSGPAMTNGRNLQYRSADTWISTGMPTTSLVDVPVQTASGHLITTDGVKASRLKPLPKG